MRPTISQLGSCLRGGGAIGSFGSLVTARNFESDETLTSSPRLPPPRSPAFSISFAAADWCRRTVCSKFLLRVALHPMGPRPPGCLRLVSKAPAGFRPQPRWSARATSLPTYEDRRYSERILVWTLITNNVHPREQYLLLLPRRQGGQSWPSPATQF